MKITIYDFGGQASFSLKKDATNEEAIQEFKKVAAFHKNKTVEVINYSSIDFSKVCNVYLDSSTEVKETKEVKENGKSHTSRVTLATMKCYKPIFASPSTAIARK